MSNDLALDSLAKLLRGRLQRGNWPQQLRLEEPASKGRQDDWRETDRGGKDQQARTADHRGA